MPQRAPSEREASLRHQVEAAASCLLSGDWLGPPAMRTHKHLYSYKAEVFWACGSVGNTPIITGNMRLALKPSSAAHGQRHAPATWQGVLAGGPLMKHAECAGPLQIVARICVHLGQKSTLAQQACGFAHVIIIQVAGKARV